MLLEDPWELSGARGAKTVLFAAFVMGIILGGFLSKLSPLDPDRAGCGEGGSTPFAGVEITGEAGIKGEITLSLSSNSSSSLIISESNFKSAYLLVFVHVCFYSLLLFCL